MADIEKKVRISGEASHFEEMMDRLSDSGSELYNRLKQEAEQYSDNLKDQLQYIKDILDAEQKRNENRYRYQKSKLEESKEKQLEDADFEFQRKQIRQKFATMESLEKSDYHTGKSEVVEARQSLSADQLKLRMQKDAEGSEGGGFASGTMGTLGSVGKAGMSGLGIGAGLGIAGLVYELAQKGDELYRSMFRLNSVMSGLGSRTDSSATSIGKTETQMNELTQQLAIITGGTLDDTRGVAKRLTEFSKAYGIDESKIVNLMQFQKFNPERFMNEERGGLDESLSIILGELDRSGAINISSGNFADLGNQLDYIYRINNMMSNNILNPDFNTGTSILSGFQQLDLRGTGAKDPRIVGDIEKINQAISNPDDDFKKSFIYEALRQPGDSYLDTMMRMEQGVGEKGENIKLVLDKVRDEIGTGDEAVLFVNRLLKGFGIQLSNKLIEAFRNGNYDEILGKEIETLHRYDPDKTKTRERAEEMTPETEVLSTELKNFMGQAGALGIEEIAGKIKTLVEGTGISTDRVVIDSQGSVVVLGKDVGYGTAEWTDEEKRKRPEWLKSFLKHFGDNSGETAEPTKKREDLTEEQTKVFDSLKKENEKNKKINENTSALNANTKAILERNENVRKKLPPSIKNNYKEQYDNE